MDRTRNDRRAAACRITRTGRCIGLGEDSARLEIEGKTVRVPIGKIAPGVRQGDEVAWSGTLWVARNA